MTRSRLTTTLGILVLFLSGCGGDSNDAPIATDGGEGKFDLLADPVSLSDLSRSERGLDVDALSKDALEPAALAGVLEGADFEGGVEVEYTGRTKLYSHVVTRTLLFAKPAGASAYLQWLDRNAADILGPVKSRGPLSLYVDGVLFLEQGCNCHSNLPTYLAAWRDGSDVHTLLADGAGVNARRVRALARELGEMIGR